MKSKEIQEKNIKTKNLKNITETLTINYLFKSSLNKGLKLKSNFLIRTSSTIH